MGRWNGFGGKVEPGETIEAAARRELKEEAMIDAIDLEKFGIIDFEFKESGEILQVHIFKTKEFSGEPAESDEMRPQWFSVDAIPYDQMWQSDKDWIPLVIKETKFKGRVLFDANDNVLEQKLIETDNLS